MKRLRLLDQTLDFPSKSSLVMETLCERYRRKMMNRERERERGMAWGLRESSQEKMKNSSKT